MLARRRPKSFGHYDVTPRRIANAERRQRAEREALPLFAAEIAAGQPAIDDVMAARVAITAKNEREWRASTAHHWRSTRRLFYALPRDSRDALRAKMRAQRFMPATSSTWTYLIGLEADRLGIELPPVTWDGRTLLRRRAGGVWVPATEAT